MTNEIQWDHAVALIAGAAGSEARGRVPLGPRAVTALPEGEAVMADTPMDVLVAGYQDLDKARKDFDGLVGLVKGRQVKVEGVILVAHDESGEVTVADTGDHAGRKGLGWGAGVGVVVGLFAPPLLASAAVGGAAGALAGKFADHQLQAGNRGQRSQALPPGSAGVIAVFPDDDRLAIERALAGSIAKSLVESDSTGLIKGL